MQEKITFGSKCEHDSSDVHGTGRTKGLCAAVGYLMMMLTDLFLSGYASHMMRGSAILTFLLHFALIIVFKTLLSHVLGTTFSHLFLGLPLDLRPGLFRFTQTYHRSLLSCILPAMLRTPRLP